MKPTKNKILLKTDIHMGHMNQDGEKVDEMSLFFLKWEAGTDR